MRVCEGLNPHVTLFELLFQELNTAGNRSVAAGAGLQEAVDSDLHGRRLDLLVRSAPRIEADRRGGHLSESNADRRRAADPVGLLSSLCHDVVLRFLPRIVA